MESKTPNPIILYDGVCPLCNRFVRFILKRDSRDRFRFASLQSDFAVNLLRHRGVAPQNLDTVYIVLHHGQPNERLAARSDAGLVVLQEIGGVWAALEGLLRLMPRPLRDWGYKAIARNRYHTFGKYDSCPLPQEKYRHKFLDQ
jgi:predicted DCC family thiol-disulfide oxidoreductase YuxK